MVCIFGQNNSCVQAFSTIRNTVTLPNGILFTKHSYEEHGDLHLFKFILYGFGPTPTVVLRRTLQRQEQDAAMALHCRSILSSLCLLKKVQEYEVCDATMTGQGDKAGTIILHISN